jgi:hypothetical protein
MTLTLPFWFPLRQGKAEPAGPDTFKLTAPNLPPAFISIRRADNGRWAARLRREAEGEELAASPAEFPGPVEAWEAAFELYRTHVVI